MCGNGLNIIEERLKFFSLKWDKNHSADWFYNKLKSQSVNCQFLESDNLIRDMILLNTHDKEFQKKLIEINDLNLDKLLFHLNSIDLNGNLKDEVKKEYEYFDVNIKVENDIYECQSEDFSEKKTKTLKNILKQFACSHCDKVFAKKTKLTRHLKVHQVEGLFICEYCKREFTRFIKFDKHVSKHKRTRDLICDECGKSFIKQNALRIHQLNTHQKIEIQSTEENKNDEVKKISQGELTQLSDEAESSLMKYICDLCGRNYKNKEYLNIHIRSHTGERPYACSFCDKKFASSGYLRNHEKVHSEKTLQCPHCPKIFSDWRNFYAHERIHLDIKPFKCEVCDKAFRHHKSLRNHRRLHTGECPYKCNECEKAFPQLTGLKNHQKTHSSKLKPV